MLNDLGPLLLVLIPIVAIIGGITSGIVRTLSRQKMIELAQRERIAAIERGIDPSKLPPLPMFDSADLCGSSDQWARRRSQRMMVAGVIFMSLSIGIFFVARVTEPDKENWVAAVIPACVGIALL